MKTLRILYAHFADECQGVEEYIGDAFTVKREDPELAKAYAEMAKAEFGHASKIHEHMVRIVKELCDCDQMPLVVLDIWDDLHGKMVKDLNKAKNYLDMYAYAAK